MLIPQEIEYLLESAITEGLCGAALGVVNTRGERQTLVLGQAQQQPHVRALHRDMWWDLASLTKPLVTGRHILRAHAAGKLDLHGPVGEYLQDKWIKNTSLQHCTILELLTHTAGLPAWLPLYTWGTRGEIFQRLVQEITLQPPGQVVYSDIGYIVLGLLLEQLYGPISELAQDAGLGFSPDPAQFNPAQFNTAQCVTTEYCQWRGRLLCGEVHDENAAALGGAAGHAGLFGTLEGVLAQAEQILSGQWLPHAVQHLIFEPHGTEAQHPQRTAIFATKTPGWSGGALCSLKLWATPDLRAQAYGLTQRWVWLGCC